MLTHLKQFLAITLACVALDLHSAPIVTNISELLNIGSDELATGRWFSVSGTITGLKDRDFFLSDGNSCIPVRMPTNSNLSIGDTIAIDSGLTRVKKLGIPVFEARSYRKTGSQNIPQPFLVSIHDLEQGLYDFTTVCVRGRVQECFPDEVDVNFFYLVITQMDQPEKGSLLCSVGRQFQHVQEGSVVELIGAYYPWVSSLRRYMGPILLVPPDHPVKIISKPSDDIDSLPTPPNLLSPSPSKIRSLGQIRLEGTVLATWGGKRFLIRSNDDLIHRVSLANGQTLPACNDIVKVGGTAETDLYLINLSHATHKTLGRDERKRTESPVPLSPETILCNATGERQINPEYYGQAISIVGFVTNPQSVLSDGEHIYLDCGKHIVPVDISSIGSDFQDVPLGSKVEAVGICLLDIDNWMADAPTPKITGFSVIARSQDDIRILSYPSWWTTGRFVFVIAALITGLLVFLVWIRFLNRLVDRRSRELLREQISRATAELKVAERTRLAVELHDSLSQNLSGVACQLVAMKYAIRDSPDSVAEKLQTAEQMLQSSRTELRRCLFDLRGSALEIADMNEAIRETVMPVAGNAELKIRFCIPRAILVDTTSHAILCIIRELVSNATRHGNASQIRIAGDIKDHVLSFSVRDNGCGFSTSDCPGPATGHFGLQGIRDRVDRLGGNFTISSTPQGGTRAKVEIRIHSEPSIKP